MPTVSLLTLHPLPPAPKHTGTRVPQLQFTPLSEGLTSLMGRPHCGPIAKGKPHTHFPFQRSSQAHPSPWAAPPGGPRLVILLTESRFRKLIRTLFSFRYLESSSVDLVYVLQDLVLYCSVAASVLCTHPTCWPHTHPDPTHLPAPRSSRTDPRKTVTVCPREVVLSGLKPLVGSHLWGCTRLTTSNHDWPAPLASRTRGDDVGRSSPGGS